VTVFAVLVPTDFSTLFFEPSAMARFLYSCCRVKLSTRAARNLTEDLEARISKLRR
jgi:hypothetical protein